LAAVIIVVTTRGRDETEDGQHREQPPGALLYGHVFPLISPSNA
jgi:hypothetical protein